MSASRSTSSRRSGASSAWRSCRRAGTAAGDFNGDGRSDLAASSVHENADAGALWSLRGTSTGLTVTNAVAFGPKDLAAPSVAALFGSDLR